MSEQCIGCGAEISYEGVSESLKCPYCGFANEISRPEDRLPEEIEKIIPLSISQDDLEKRVYAYMASGEYTPDNMLESSTFIKRECFYVPAFLFRINYQATWTASFGYDRAEQYTEYVEVTKYYSNGSSYKVTEPKTRTKTVTHWQPANGVDSGIFSVSYYAGRLLNESGLGPADLVADVISEGNITDYNPSFMKGVQTESFSVQEGVSFASIEGEINSNIDSRVQNHGQGDHQENWHWNATMSHSTTTLYVPICHAVFDYDGEEYQVWIDGIGSSGIRADKLPEDKDRKKQVYLGFVPLLAALAALIATSIVWGFTWFGLVLVALLGGYAALRRNSILGYSQNIRDSLLTQLHASSTTNKDIGSEERDKLARAFQRPEKPLLAKTQRDMVFVPILSLLALVGVSLPGYMMSLDNNGTAQTAELLIPENYKTDTAASKPIVDTPTDHQALVEAPPSSPNEEVDSLAIAEIKEPPPPEPKPVQPSEIQNSNADLAEATRQEANNCMRQQNYDCAEANFKTVLRLLPNDSSSIKAISEINGIREIAFKGDWNAK